MLINNHKICQFIELEFLGNTQCNKLALKTLVYKTSKLTDVEFDFTVALVRNSE